MNIEKLNFPKYNGNETQYEYIFYTYLDVILVDRGYISKIKKTSYENIDNNIVSMKAIKNGSCDSYILSDNEPDSLFALLELESTGKVDTGIKQVKEYAKGLHISFKTGKFITKHETIYLIVYDGQLLWVAEFNLKTAKEKIILSSGSTGIEVYEEEKDKLISLFPKKNIVNTNEDEKTLIKTIKNILRANKTLQGNKAFILTVLASIYGNTKKNKFNIAIEFLRTQADSNNETKEIFEKWSKIKNKIEYDNSPDIQDKITELYEKVSIKLFMIAQDKKLDLYGYIYEELAEKSSKKEEGEYYTPRTHIRPIVNSIFEKYLRNAWGLLLNKDKAIEILNSKNIIDPFCGSAGFLYEYLKILKQNYGFTDNEINDIAASSLNGFDKNDITAAYFNLFLIGDGRSKLTQVTTSINWENYWKYELIESKKSKKVQLLTNKDKIESSIEKNVKTFIPFLNNLGNIDFIKDNFTLPIQYKIVNCTLDILEIFMKDNNLKHNEFFNKLAIPLYKDDKNPVMLLLYNTLVEISSNEKHIGFKSFLNNMGNIDFLMTNVPYGDIDDARIKGDYSQKLESQALKECIDLLKPSTSIVNNTTGRITSNEDGGIATIVIPNGLLERDEYELKEYLLKRCDVLSIVKLPFYTFSPYALIQTYFITFRKKAVFEFENYIQKHDVFMYIIDNDGKANSDKRFETKLISKNRNDIVSNNQTTSVYEYIHNELSINLEEYPEGYSSKIERAWVQGNLDGFDISWNQERITEKWDGTDWAKLDGKKWAYQNLELKDYKKQIEIQNKKISEAIKNLLIEDESFADLEIEEKKEYISNYSKKEYISKIKYAKINESNNECTLYGVNSKTVNNQGLKEFILKAYSSVFDDSKNDITPYYDDIISMFDGNYNSDVNLIIEVLSTIDDIIIFDNGNDIKLISNQCLKLYDLNINNYLDSLKFMKHTDIKESLLRLLVMQGKNNFDSGILDTEINNALKEVQGLNYESKYIPLHLMIEGFQERGNRITIEDIYNNYGEYPVYSSTITGNIGFFNQFNYTLNDDSFIYAIEGNAGSISIPTSLSNKVWLLDVAGVINLKEEYINGYKKEIIAVYLEYLFRNNRHNNSGQPKFLIKKNLDLQVDLSVLEILNRNINV